MPTEHQSRGLDYGAAAAGSNVDFAEDASLEGPGTRDKALIDKLKDALRPGDARKIRSGSTSAPSSSSSTAATDTTHDGRHGGIEEVMQPGHRDYDESAHHRGNEVRQAPLSGILGQTRSGFEQMKSGGEGEIGLMDAIKRKAGAGRHEEYRDSSNLRKTDESKAPGSMYQTLRDEFFK
ncbi:hypothetical protein F5Y08DRAFT_335234 [Xylaria arbuscula]|nr:hypothetical protein F5Y08DRAFT_335234 [Xylaria arbuscula]